MSRGARTGRNRPRVPRRTCVQCGAPGDKASLVRIAGRPGEAWEPDPGAVLPGRGFYLCRTAACIGGFVRRIRTARGGARWRMTAASGTALAERLSAWWSEEGRNLGGVDG